MYYNVNISASSNLGFVNQNIGFEISATPISAFNYFIQYSIGGTTYSASTSSFTHSYTNWGVFTPWAHVSADNGSGNTLGTPITINPLPEINVSGSQILGNNLTLSLANSALYSQGNISTIDWNFGDGGTSSTVDLSSTVQHVYGANGTYTVIVTINDVSGNAGVGTTNVGIFESNICETKNEYIILSGPNLVGRYGPCKKINLVDFLPQYVRDTDTKAFLQIFENFLNEMFPGYCGFQLTSAVIPVDEQYVTSSISGVKANDRLFKYSLLETPTVSSVPSDTLNVTDIMIDFPNNYSATDPRISILEKVKRLTELQDPDLIDIEYINYFAKNLGYQVDIQRSEVIGDLGNLASLEDPSLSAVDQNKYLRFVISNLPNWYKIKTTNNAVKVMLYSFGLIGDLINIYTDSYKSGSIGGLSALGQSPPVGQWRLDNDGKLTEIPNGWFPTPHFAININIEESTNISFDIARKQSVIKAIESIRPINTFFERLNGYITFYKDMYVEPQMRFTRYISVTSDDSDFWV